MLYFGPFYCVVNIKKQETFAELGGKIDPKSSILYFKVRNIQYKKRQLNSITRVNVRFSGYQSRLTKGGRGFECRPILDVNCGKAMSRSIYLSNPGSFIRNKQEIGHTKEY